MSFLKRVLSGKDGKKGRDPKGEDIVLQILKEEGILENVHSEIINHELVIYEYKMSIKARIANKTQHSNELVAQLDFIIQQDNFETEIFESMTGIGRSNDIKDAVRNGVANFVSGILEALIESLQDRHDPKLDFETTLGGNTHVWHPKIGTLQMQGYCDMNNVDQLRIFNILRDKIIPWLGAKQFYLVKVYVSRQPGGQVISQCTINNEPFSNVQKRLEEYARGWTTGNRFKGEQQFIIIRQCDKTWRQGKYSYDNLRQYVFEVMEQFQQCSNPIQYNLLYEKMVKLTGDIDLAIELYSFLPEICCRIKFPEIMFSDEIILVRPDGTRNTTLLSRLSNFTIFKTLVTEKMQSVPGQDKYNRVLYPCATFKAINDALIRGSKLENLTVLPLTINVTEDYDPYR